MDTLAVDNTKIIKPSFNNTMLKYAAILILFVSFSAISINYYFDSVKSFNENSYSVASKEINKKIQNQTDSKVISNSNIDENNYLIQCN